MTLSFGTSGLSRRPAPVVTDGEPEVTEKSPGLLGSFYQLTFSLSLTQTCSIVRWYLKW